MQTQYGTDPHELARTTDPDTSKEAAQRVDDVGWEKKVHSFIIRKGLEGATAQEITDFYGLQYCKTISPRFAPLRRKGLIFDSGLRRDSKNVYMDKELSRLWATVGPYGALKRMVQMQKKTQGVGELREEVKRLRDLLLSHGIDPDQNVLFT